MSLAKRLKMLTLLVLLPCLTLMLLAYSSGEAFAQGTTDEGLLESMVSNANTFWDSEFQKLGLPYTPAKLKFVYNKGLNSVCGSFSTQDGPAYCPANKTIYYPLYWQDNGQTLASYGSGAMEWAVGHEVGHNVQLQMYEQGFQNLSPYPETLLVEMQADCFAGMYANQASAPPESIKAALGAMLIVSQERIAAFELGYKTGDLSQCLALAHG
jgi:predicted metalloprotease